MELSATDSRTSAARNCHGYRLLPVFGATTPELRQRVCAFWLHEGALHDAATAARRVHQLACMAENAAGEVVGVATVYAATERRSGQRFYFYRTFMRKQDRGSRLPRSMLRLTYDSLRARHFPHRPRGVVIAAENPKLARRAARRELEKLGWDYFGLNPRGQHTWVKGFTPGRGDSDRGVACMPSGGAP